MKKMIITLFVFTSLIVSAQDTTWVEQYCRVIITSRALSTKVNIEIDFGEERKLFAHNRLRDEMSGKLKDSIQLLMLSTIWMPRDGHS